MPKVSVIIPVYNVEKYLGECLDSVVGQTLRDIEIICVDDGSTDGSPAMLSAYAARDGRIRIITQRNSGQSAARNAGMDEARGEYVYFLDSDDWIASDALESCAAICDRDRLDHLVFGCRLQVEGDLGMDAPGIAAKRAYYENPLLATGEVVSGGSLLGRLIGDGTYHCLVSMRLMRRSMLLDAGLRFYEGLIHEDEGYTPLAMICAARAEAVPDRFYVRRWRVGSTMTNAGATGKSKHLAHLMVVYCLLRSDAAHFCDTPEKRAAVKVAMRKVERVMVSRRRNPQSRDAFGMAVGLPGAPSRARLAVLFARLTLKAFLAKAGSRVAKILHVKRRNTNSSGR